MLPFPPASIAQELNFTSISPCTCRRCLLDSLRQNSHWGWMLVAGQGAESRVWLPRAPQQAVARRQHLGASHTRPSAKKSASRLLESQPGISAGTWGSSCEANLSYTIYFPISLPGPCSQTQPRVAPPSPGGVVSEGLPQPEGRQTPADRNLTALPIL